MIRLLFILLLTSCALKRPEPHHTIIYSSEEACKMELEANMAKAKRYSEIIDSFITLRDSVGKQYDDSVKYYSAKARADIAPTDKEWNEFMRQYTARKFGVDPRKIQNHQIK